VTSRFDLNLPLDIPWERICVSRDMMDPRACDDETPPKWQSSVAVFRYVPGDEYQNYPNCRVTYLKVTASIGGYQPRGKEIQGSIDWNGVHADTIDDVDALLDTYHPCTGALLQVTVAPHARDVDLDDYPFFLDFQPKTRSLYEMATDTKEHSSRSEESLRVGKSAGSLKSQEVLDVDQGGSQSFGIEGSYAGAGVGVQGSSSRAGMWGTKSMGSRTGEVIRTTDSSQESRETDSHTTQLSHLYHLLDAYHLGTNRALFFIQPRPHTLEEPSGFVRGPRPVEGIQEFFLVVAQPKDQENFCTSVRLDTAHLTEIDLVKPDYRREERSASAGATAPTIVDTEVIKTEIFQMTVNWPHGGKLGDRNYQCYIKRDDQSFTYVPSWRDFKINREDNNGYTITRNPVDHGTTSVQVSPDGESAVVTCVADAHNCFDIGGCICYDCPQTTGAWSASALIQVVFNLVSRTPTINAGKRRVMLVTARGVCCCKDLDPGSLWKDVIVMGVYDVAGLYLQRGLQAPSAVAGDKPQPPGPPPPPEPLSSAARVPMAGSPPADAAAHDGLMTTREANDLSDIMREQLLRAASAPPHRRPHPSYVYNDVFAEQLHARLQQNPFARRMLLEPALDHLPDRALKRLSEAFGMPPKQITRGSVAAVSNAELARIIGSSTEAAAKLRLTALGLPAPRPPQPPVKGPVSKPRLRR
jgi:hypothetical protein